jgi:hypothetical protein
VTGGRLTDIADAYLMDHTLPERVVVVASLGATTLGGAEMGVPNGELDTWADIIVAQKFRYVQVSTYYDSATDVPASLVSQLPTNPFTSWIVTGCTCYRFWVSAREWLLTTAPDYCCTALSARSGKETRSLIRGSIFRRRWLALVRGCTSSTRD